MDREIVSKEKLLSILNEELSQYKECNNCHFHKIDKLRDTDKDGCNWSSIVTLRRSGPSPDICDKFASRIITKIRALYNLE